METQSFDQINSQLPSIRSLPPYSSPLESFWTKNHKTPFQNTNSFGKFPKSEDQVDIVIIGSGITGISTVHHLVESLLSVENKIHKDKKVKIVILESRSFCSGATGRNGGHLSTSASYHFDSISRTYSQEDALASVLLENRSVDFVLDLCTEEGWNEEVELTTNGTLHLFQDQASENLVRKEMESAILAGVDVKLDFLDADQVLKECGAVAYSGIIIPGNNLYPLKLVSNILGRTLKMIEESASKMVSVDLYTNTLVKNVSPCQKGEKKWSIETSRGNIYSDYIIHCTNAYASYLLPQFSKGSSRVVPTRGQVVSISPSITSNPNWKTGFSANDGFEYYFQRSAEGKEIILGGARSQALKSNYEFGLTNDGEINQVVSLALREYIVNQFPNLSLDSEQGGMKVEMEWTGIMGFTESGAPIVGPVFCENGERLEGQFISAGYTGHGMSRAPACAEAISLMVLAELSKSNYFRPNWLPEYYTTEYYKLLDSKQKKVEKKESNSSRVNCCCVV